MPAVGFAVAAFLSLIGSPHFFMGTAFYVFTVLQYLLLYYGIWSLVHRFVGAEDALFGLSCSVPLPSPCMACISTPTCWS